MTHERRSVVHIMDGQSLVSANVRLPQLTGEKFATLVNLVEKAWANPDGWYSFPDCECFLRAVPVHGGRGDICFDIRYAERPDGDGIARYLYERIRGILVLQQGDVAKHHSNSCNEKPDRQILATALEVLSAYEQALDGWKVIRRIGRTDPLEPNRIPKNSTLGELAHRVTDHWFAPRTKKWLWRRIFFTFSGCITFFLFWTGYIVGATGGFDSPNVEFLSWSFLIISLIGAFWFTGLSAWENLGYGPIRLFLSGFLLPYFVWTLVAVMYTRPFPDLRTSLAPAPDTGIPFVIPEGIQ